MKILKVAIGLIIAYVSLKISIPITNSLVQFEMGLGTWIINLFILSPIYLIVLLGLTGLIGVGAWSFLSYILILSAVNIENNKDTVIKIKRPSIIGVLGKTLIGGIGMIGFAIIILIIGVASLSTMGELSGKQNQSQFEKRFDTTHPNTNYVVEEFNVNAAKVAATDYRFIYYLKELSAASSDFVNADEVIDVFEADVKREFAIACMRDVLIEKVANTGFGTMEGYKMNALNAVGNKLKAMKNVKLMDKSRSIYHYPATYGYGYYILDKDYANRCNDTVSVDDMFDDYLPIYLKDKKVDAEKARLSENDNRARHLTKGDATL